MIKVINTMPWYGWIILFLGFSAIISPLFSLLKSNKNLELTEQEKKFIRERNQKWDDIDKEDQ